MSGFMVKIYVKWIGPVPKWDFFHPIDSFNQAIISAQKFITKTIEALILNPSGALIENPVTDVLTRSQNNLALYLAYCVFGLVLILACLTVKNGMRVGSALVIWLLLSVLGPYWSDIVWGLRDSGLQFADLISRFTAPQMNRVKLFDFGIADALVSIVVVGFNLLIGLMLASLLNGYEIVIFVFQLWALPAVALSSLGPRAKKFSNIIIAIGLTATFGGRAAALFFLEAGMWSIDTLPGGSSPFGAAIFTMFSIGAAFVAQIVLIVVFYHGVVYAQSKASAIVAGTVATTVDRVVRVVVEDFRRNRHAGPMAVHVTSVSADANAEAAQAAKKREITKNLSNAAQVAAASSGHPEAMPLIKAVERKVA